MGRNRLPDCVDNRGNADMENGLELLMECNVESRMGEEGGRMTQ